MKKVLLASLLAFAGVALMGQPCVAQLGTNQAAGGQVQMSPEEYAKYNAAVEQKDPTAKAAAFEAYLKAYPNSAVKAEALQQMMFAYSQSNNSAQTLDAADRLLQLQPENLRALVFEVYLRRTAADANTDPAAKAAALDVVAGYAEKGLHAPKPAEMTDAEYQTLKAQAEQTFESAIADDDVAKKDESGAIAALTTEINAAPVADTEKPSTTLQDIYVLAQAYRTLTPPDYLHCAWYATRAAAFAPAAYKPQIQPLATYCYKAYHGGEDGYDTMQTLAQTNLNLPPSCAAGAPPTTTTGADGKPCLTVKPAPKPADVVANLIATTPDLATLALSDKEFVIEYGRPAVAEQPATATTPAVPAQPADADKVFDTIKGKSVEIPGALVIAATPDQLQVAVSDEAVSSKTADFTFNMKEPIKTADMPAVGAKVTLDGTYASYTQKPLMITMSDSALVLPKKAAPARRPVRRRR